MTKTAYFETPAGFRTWLKRNHDKAKEILVGFYKRHSGKKSITYDQALDEALCFGWIDGVRRTVDENRYTVRFSPRRSGSVWSLVNIKRARELKASGRMEPPGLGAFEQRDEKKARQYSYEQRNPALGAAHQRRFQANKPAWDFFRSQPPWYQRTCTWWVISAKKEETREKRLSTLIETCAKRAWIAPLSPTRKAPV